jgi:hypothetical protein
MNWKGAVALIALTVMACSRTEDSTTADRALPRDTTPAPAAGAPDSAHAHTAAPTPAAPHTDHGTGSPMGAQAHAAHQRSGRRAAEAHERHTRAAGRPDAGEHALHAARRDTTAHAAHAVARDSAPHAVHAPARDTTAHAAHQMPRADSAQHAHAPAAQDSARHAGHTPAAPQQQHAHAPVDSAIAVQHAGMQHDMTMLLLGGGWMAIGMAQIVPTATIALPADDGTPLARRGLYLTQPALMFNIESTGSGVSLRTTLNFEGVTQPAGELTFGGWGEGFLDKRHPHTLLHEAMLSVNIWARDGGGFSVSAGKGFAPYGTDDPMSRPIVKYPTNHHLSQILERWTLNAVYASPQWSAEVGVFGGNEPTSPWDFSNIESFANSWSARVTGRLGVGRMGFWPWEVSASFGHVKEEHDDGARVTHLFNAALRHEKIIRSAISMLWSRYHAVILTSTMAITRW